MSKFQLKYFVVYFEVHPDAPKKKFFDSVRDCAFLTRDRNYLVSDLYDSIDECQSFIGSLSHFNYPVSIFLKSV